MSRTKEKSAAALASSRALACCVENGRNPRRAVDGQSGVPGQVLPLTFCAHSSGEGSGGFYARGAHGA
eukprot:4554546-Pleurochrysis_carterae.AAC.1